MITVWHLELVERSSFKRSAEPLRFRLERVTAPTPAFLRFLYVATGSDWRWTDRLPWTDAQWLARQADPNVEFWVAMDEGAPAGYFELARHDDGRTVEMLSAAVERGWEMGAARVYVNTCSLDHPVALENYKRRGFEIFDVRER